MGSYEIQVCLEFVLVDDQIGVADIAGDCEFLAPLQGANGSDFAIQILQGLFHHVPDFTIGNNTISRLGNVKRDQRVRSRKIRTNFAVIRHKDFVVLQRGLHPVNRNEGRTFDNVEQHWLDFHVSDSGEMGCEFMPFGSLSGENHVVRFFDFVTHVFCLSFLVFWFLSETELLPIK